MRVKHYIWDMFKLLFLAAAIHMVPFAVEARDVKHEICLVKAETMVAIKQASDKGLPKSKLLMIYQGSDEWNVGVRKMVHKIYNGDADNISAKQLHDTTYDICISR